MKKSLKILFLSVAFAILPIVVSAAGDSVEFTMHTDIYDIQYGGRVAIENRFERPVIASESPAAVKINNDLIAKSRLFYEKSVENEISYYAESAYTMGETYNDNITAQVVKNENGILCIKFEREWFMGGVADGGLYGVTYNIYTGEELKIPDLFDMEAAEVEKYIKDKAIAHVSQPDFYPYAAQTVRDCDINDFNFYVEGDTLYVCFTKYEVIYGAAGPQIIEYSIINPKEFSPVKVLLNGKEVEFDVHPQIINDRTMVPMRAIFEQLGATVEWDGETKTVTSVKDETVISLTIGVPSIITDGAEKVLDVAPVIIDGRTLVPVRAVSEAFMLNVDWDADTKTVIITN